MERATTGKSINTLEGHTNWVFSVAFDQNGLLASASADKTIRVFGAE
jgi:WD40 repeat protein